jgi:hypothetical protein
MPHLDTHSCASSATTRKKCASLGGEPTATGGDVKEGFGLSLGISWLSGALLFPSEGVEEDLLLCFWSIYIEEVLLGFLPHEGFPG